MSLTVCFKDHGVMGRKCKNLITCEKHSIEGGRGEGGGRGSSLIVWQYFYFTHGFVNISKLHRRHRQQTEGKDRSLNLGTI